jgi:hypothetical protein
MTELDDPFLCSELHGFEGSLFDPKEMERLAAAYYQGLFFWNDDYIAYLYRSWPERRKAAPIAEIIEQAKEEAFLAWGL